MWAQMPPTILARHNDVVRKMSITKVTRPWLFSQRTRCISTTFSKSIALQWSEFSSSLKIGHLDVNHVRDKIENFSNMLKEHQLPILAITETWLIPGISDGEVIFRIID